ncbi:hypothetical protein B0T26DRAFT_678536 [Lasiosphaeria miniovina]|uniref:Vacuolar ATPase assembly protein VMA22 n=1 Tax=Lasiosphaeria miniovina TaxID=1954250 RepID=A0AA40A4K8_9PEZI|nr:uncharacterized protein B0T26DRAFT_678536 [Lasiosphaeria miniovina]KAK0709063.1 hypothetical protein B0T26DRAFT_678536 [Lasiosphaeria miniovina]
MGQDLAEKTGAAVGPQQQQQPHQAPSRNVADYDDAVDSLLLRYLSLLDEYTRLRAALGALQSTVFQSLARANFTAERGVRRYGQDYYDERMQATRRLRVTTPGAGAGGSPVFEVVVHSPEEDDKDEGEAAEVEVEPANGVDEQQANEEKPNEQQQQPAQNNNKTKKKKPKPHDPLRWFGVLTPMALRAAQGQAVEAVHDLVPRLATVSAEMAGVEVEVRRTRKKRAKAVAAEEKRQQEEEENKLEKRVDGRDKPGRAEVLAE